MADENEEVEKKGPNIMLVVLGTAVITLLLGGGGLFAAGVFDSSPSQEVASEATAEKNEGMSKPKSPNVEIEEIFNDSVTLKDNSKLVFRIVAEIPKEDKMKEELLRRLPALQHEIILYISSFSREEFSGRNKKVDTLNRIQSNIQKYFTTRDIKVTINALYFTKFDLQ